MTANTIERARGRWREILPRLGVDPVFLINRHGPCPLCGGVDRFRFDDRDGTGSYYCNQCGAGVGVILVRKMRGWDHKTACDAIDKVLGTALPPAPVRANVGADPAKRVAALERVLREASDPGLVRRYLASRGLRAVPAILRGHRALPYVDADGEMRRLPAMVAPVLGPDDALQSVHRTYIANVAKRKKLMPAVDTVRGAAIRLFGAMAELGVAEGVETAIAANEMFTTPTWAVISSGNMEIFVPPERVTRMRIFADNDRNFVGQRAAFMLAQRMVRERPDMAVEVLVPPEPGTDWCDALKAQRGAAS